MISQAILAHCQAEAPPAEAGFSMPARAILCEAFSKRARRSSVSIVVLASDCTSPEKTDTCFSVFFSV